MHLRRLCSWAKKSLSSNTARWAVLCVKKLYLELAQHTPPSAANLRAAICYSAHGRVNSRLAAISINSLKRRTDQRNKPIPDQLNVPTRTQLAQYGIGIRFERR